MHTIFYPQKAKLINSQWTVCLVTIITLYLCCHNHLNEIFALWLSMGPSCGVLCLVWIFKSSDFMLWYTWKTVLEMADER